MRCPPISVSRNNRQWHWNFYLIFSNLEGRWNCLRLQLVFLIVSGSHNRHQYLYPKGRKWTHYWDWQAWLIDLGLSDVMNLCCNWESGIVWCLLETKRLVPRGKSESPHDWKIKKQKGNADIKWRKWLVLPNCHSTTMNEGKFHLSISW